MELTTKNEFAKAINLPKIKMEMLAPPLMKLLKIDTLNKIYENNHRLQGIDFVNAVLKECKVNFSIDETELKNIPKEGPFIVAANHPFGGIDGLIMLKLIATARPDFKMLANFILNKIKNIEPFIIPVNPFKSLSQYNDYNPAGIKAALTHLANGCAVGIFPAGEVSAFQMNGAKIADLEWNPVIGKLIFKAKAPVIPIYFHGSNSILFNTLSLVHPTLGTARLPGELLNKQDEKIIVRIGKPVMPDDFEKFESSAHLLRFLRTKTYLLGSSIKVKKFFNNPFKVKRKPKKIIDALPLRVIEKEITAFGEANLLAWQGDFEVYVACSAEIPNILKEIGRLREITFREVGEGTNRSIDVDEYDLYYHHLFLWDKKNRKIAGAYRIGTGKEIYEYYGKKGFYIHSLFRIKRPMVPILKKSLELGRSFVRKEYQQKPAPLFLLWKGILVYLKMNPQYNYLIGPVSISNDFSRISRRLIVDFIRKNHFDNELSKYVKPRKKFRYRAEKILISPKDKSIQSLDELISEIEPSHGAVPILLKKYLKLNAKLLGFNLDPKFNHSLDGFMVLDLKKVPDETMKMLNKK